MKLAITLAALVIVGQCGSFLEEQPQMGNKVFKIELKRQESASFSKKDMFDFIGTS